MLTNESFSGLIEQKDLGRVTNSFTEIIGASFLADGAPMTRSEVKRRFEICVGIFKQLRGDLHWGISRILDNLPRYLRCELEGDSWTPDARGMWLPGDE